MTVETPITTPRIVRAERVFATRRESNASATFSPKSPKNRTSDRSMSISIGAHRGDRIEACGASRRVHAEQDTNARSKRERERHRPCRHSRGKWRCSGDQQRERPTTSRAERAAQCRKYHRLGEELPANVTSRGAHRLAKADL